LIVSFSRSLYCLLSLAHSSSALQFVSHRISDGEHLSRRLPCWVPKLDPRGRSALPRTSTVNDWNGDFDRHFWPLPHHHEQQQRPVDGANLTPRRSSFNPRLGVIPQNSVSYEGTVSSRPAHLVEEAHRPFVQPAKRHDRLLEAAVMLPLRDIYPDRHCR
jgi:hypothetical protein